VEKSSAILVGVRDEPVIPMVVCCATVGRRIRQPAPVTQIVECCAAGSRDRVFRAGQVLIGENLGRALPTVRGRQTVSWAKGRPPVAPTSKKCRHQPRTRANHRQHNSGNLIRNQACLYNPSESSRGGAAETVRVIQGFGVLLIAASSSFDMRRTRMV